MKLPTLNCLRCAHEWVPRTNKKPKVCPNLKCKSPYWDKPRKNPRKEAGAVNDNERKDKAREKEQV